MIYLTWEGSHRYRFVSGFMSFKFAYNLRKCASFKNYERSCQWERTNTAISDLLKKVTDSDGIHLLLLHPCLSAILPWKGLQMHLRGAVIGLAIMILRLMIQRISDTQSEETVVPVLFNITPNPWYANMASCWSATSRGHSMSGIEISFHDALVASQRLSFFRIWFFPFLISGWPRHHHHRVNRFTGQDRN